MHPYQIFIGSFNFILNGIHKICFFSRCKSKRGKLPKRDGIQKTQYNWRGISISRFFNNYINFWNFFHISVFIFSKKFFFFQRILFFDAWGRSWKVAGEQEIYDLASNYFQSVNELSLQFIGKNLKRSNRS